MKRRRMLIGIALVALGIVIPGLPAGASLNSLLNESFESYAEGLDVDGTNGWSGFPAAGGMVTTNNGVTASLTNAADYPLPLAAHEKVLKVAGVVRNPVVSDSNGVAMVDVLVWPVWSETLPAGETNKQCAFCISTNGRLMVWHYNTVAVPATNQWLELAASPVIGTNAWARFTVVQDYSNSLFAVKVNGGSLLADGAGWTGPGGSPGGTWFNMVQTNKVMNGIECAGVNTFVEDVVVTNRSLVWSGNNFNESPVNDGGIDNSVPLAISLGYDTFSGAVGENLAESGKVEVSNLPSNLGAAVILSSPTLVTVSLTNTALHHEGSDSVSNLVLRFADTAFFFGNAASVAGFESTNLTVTFRDTPVLGYSTTLFRESAANTGAIDNDTPCLISLAHGTFSGVPGEDFATNSAKLAVAHLPAGLTAEVVMLDASQLRFKVLGAALSNDAAHSLSNVTLTFGNDAFEGVPASSVFNSSTNFSIGFTDPSILVYGTTVFEESAANNGVIGNSADLALSNKSFNAVNGEDLIATHKAVVTNLPAGLNAQLVYNDATGHAVLALSGAALSHALSNSISNFGLTFVDDAFVGGNAAGVEGAARANLTIQFLDPAALEWSGTVLTEAGANNGSIGNSLLVTLANASFADVPFTAGAQYTAGPPPSGLALILTRTSSTTLVVSATGAATAHASGDSINSLQLTFLDPAFDTVPAARVAGHPVTLTVSFADQPSLNYSADGFTEQSGGVIDNRSPLVITLTGDTLSGTPGENFVTSGKITVSHLPSGLAAVIQRTSDTTLSAQLTGLAVSNASADSISNLTFAFQQGAFSQAEAGYVTGNLRTNLTVSFIDDTGFFNVLPYQEPFELYPNGTFIHGTNGWAALFDADAGIVTNDSVMVAREAAYPALRTALPVEGSHDKVLLVQGALQDAIHSASAPAVYTDFMAIPVPIAETPSIDSTQQCAFYVNTNLQLVIWHRNTTREPASNEWLVLSSAPLIDTSRWTRFSVSQDYVNNMYQLQINEGMPISDPAGWSAGGVAPTGSWFHMTRANGTMSGFRMTMYGPPAYLDDLVVQATPMRHKTGTVFNFR